MVGGVRPVSVFGTAYRAREISAGNVAIPADAVGAGGPVEAESFGDLLARLHALLKRLGDEARKLFAPGPSGPGGTYVVQPGDTLWGIATRTLGDGRRWPEIYDLNRDQIHRPEEIRPGMVLRLPGGANPAPKPEPKPPPPDDSKDIAAGLNIPPPGRNPDRATMDELLDRAADRHGIPRPILKAVALRESNWRQYDGAGDPVAGRNPTTTDWGIMQINDYWHPAAFPRAKTDIVYNILYGAGYLARQYQRYGSWPDAVAAYNAGSVRRNPDGSYVNQKYVDFVMAHARSDWGYAA